MVAPSRIGTWVECETKALHSPRVRGRLNAARWVGILAHAKLAEETEPPTPDRLSFDHITPSASHADRQAAAIAAAARAALDHADWTITATEAPVGIDSDARMDIVAWHPQLECEAVIDLKTGSVAGGWLQVGAYLEQIEQVHEHHLVHAAGILTAPRVPLGRDVHATLEIRDGLSVMNAWIVWRRRIQHVEAGAATTRSPGRHCTSCSLQNCPVRVS
ncbi:MAG: hypothetical protein F4Z29_07445 [Gemmatimonadetes bacterium]|nr:hypothetical protein [Gemmatimonadota bacterium]